MIKRLAAVLDVPVAAPRPRGRRARRRSADADHGQDGRPRRPGLLPPGARVRVPRRPDPADVPARLPVPVARRADPRLRRRDLARRAEAEAGGRRPTTAAATRSASRASRRRSTSTCNGTSGAAQIRVDSLGRPQSPLEIRRDAQPGTAVRLTIDIARPARGRAGDPRGHRAREGQQAVQRRRRRDHRARPARRRRARDGVVSRPTSRRSTSGGSTRRSSRRS